MDETYLGASLLVWFLTTVSVLVGLVVGLHRWVGGAQPGLGRRREVDHDSHHDQALREHLSLEHQTSVEAYFADRPDLLATRCPHLPGHRQIITAPIGPLNSPEVVAHLCSLCGEKSYVPGLHG